MASLGEGKTKKKEKKYSIFCLEGKHYTHNALPSRCQQHRISFTPPPNDNNIKRTNLILNFPLSVIKVIAFMSVAPPPNPVSGCTTDMLPFQEL